MGIADPPCRSPLPCGIESVGHPLSSIRDVAEERRAAIQLIHFVGNLYDGAALVDSPNVLIESFGDVKFH